MHIPDSETSQSPIGVIKLTGSEKIRGWLPDIPGIRKCHSNRMGRWRRFLKLEENGYNVGRGSSKEVRIEITYVPDIVLKGCVIPRARPDAARARNHATFQNDIRDIGYMFDRLQTHPNPRIAPAILDLLKRINFSTGSFLSQHSSHTLIFILPHSKCIQQHWFFGSWEHIEDYGNGSGGGAPL